MPFLSFRNLFLLLLTASGIALAGAFFAQYFLDMPPCILCHYQRYVYFAILPLALIGLFIASPRIQNVFLIFIMSLLLLEAGFAFYQVGIEQHIFALPKLCKAPTLAATTIEALKAQLLAQPHVSCDQIQGQLFGVSMAGYNGLYAILLLGISLVSLCKLKR